jgi:LacI family transcriptional regulator
LTAILNFAKFFPTKTFTVNVLEKGREKEARIRGRGLLKSKEKENRAMAITIKDIAREGGVSIATVSRAINQEEGLSQNTRQMILEIAARLHYHPNFPARSLVGKKTEALGIVIPQSSEFALSNPYYNELLKGIGARTNQAGYYLVLSFLREESYARLHDHHLAAGIIVLANRLDDPRVEDAAAKNIPMVLIPGDPGRKWIPSVDGDNRDGIFQAIRHLAELGHRDIAFLCGPMNSKYSVDRFPAFQQALIKYRLPFRKEFVLNYDFSQEGAFGQMKKLLAVNPPPTAVLLMNDYSAMGVLRAAKEVGFQVPRDVSVIGFGDVPLASMTDPPLTTVREPFQEMGYRAADIVLRMVEGKKLPRRTLTLPVELVIRNSTAPPGKRRRRGAP